METDDAYTIWYGPWRLCFANRFHTHIQLSISKTQTASCSPWFLNDSQTDRHIDTAIRRLTLPIMCFHIDATFKEILHSHSQDMYILDSSSNSCHQQFTKRKKRVRSFPHVLSSLALIPLVYFCNRSSTLPQMQRKIRSTAKLFFAKLLTPSLCLFIVCSPPPKLSVL
jgi:hypothetical protein